MMPVYFTRLLARHRYYDDAPAADAENKRPEAIADVGARTAADDYLRRFLYHSRNR